MIVVGLTGNIGTGKSTVSAMLSELGASVLDADKIGHDILRRADVRSEIISAFGRGVLGREGVIDRQKLGVVAFSDPAALKRLNEIMHPRIFDAVRTRLAQWREEGVRVAVVEAPLLIEADWTMSVVDRVWVTVASETTILKRLKEQKGLAEETVLARLRRQSPPEEKTGRADAVIDTDCSREELRVRVRAFWDQLVGDRGPRRPGARTPSS